MNATTFTGIVRAGKIELDPTITLPEGSQVSVVVPAILDEHLARRKANGWLIDHVGNMVMAKDGHLVQNDPQPIWQFKAFVTALSHEPLGPIGYITINAHSGQILNDLASIEAMVHVGQKLTRSP
jgi:hypothetical protein